MTTHVETVVSGVLVMLIAMVVVGALVWFFILAPKAEEDFQVSTSFTQYRAAAQVLQSPDLAIQCRSPQLGRLLAGWPRLDFIPRGCRRLRSHH